MQEKVQVIFLGTLSAVLREMHSMVVRVSFIQERLIFRAEFYEQVELAGVLIDGRSGGAVEVKDEYPRFLPYLKPVTAFRGHIMGAVSELMDGTRQGNRFLTGAVPIPRDPAFLRAGLAQYWRNLRHFDEVAATVKEARVAVNALHSGQLSQARAVLKALGETPSTDLKCISADYFAESRLYHHKLETSELELLNQPCLMLAPFPFAQSVVAKLVKIRSQVNV